MYRISALVDIFTLVWDLLTMRNNNVYKICKNLHLHRQLADYVSYIQPA